ncbi:MAG: hypothetical protein ACK5GN_02250 [Pseudomonadota bacterium]
MKRLSAIKIIGASVICACVYLKSLDLVYACDPCGLHNSVQVPGIINTLRSTGLQSGSYTFGAQQQLSTFTVRGENDLRTTESDLELIKTLSVTQASLGYNISDSVAGQVNVPFIIRSYERFERFKKVEDTEAGFGDMSVSGTYSPYSYNDVDSRVFLATIGGVKLPTGDTGSLTRIASEDPTTADQRIQGRGLTLGTGSFDLPFGIIAFGRHGRAVAFASTQYTIRGEGAADYRFANDLLWTAAPGYLFLLGEEESLTTSLVLSGEHKGEDSLDGAALSKTSANNLYLGADLFYSLTNRISLQLALDFPVSLDVGGAAVKPQTRSRLAFSMSF